MEKYFTAEVKFYKGMRKTFPKNGYRPDTVFEGQGKSEYWGISFISLEGSAFDEYKMAEVKFSFQDHYNNIKPYDLFSIMEGQHKVGEGRVISVKV